MFLTYRFEGTFGILAFIYYLFMVFSLCSFTLLYQRRNRTSLIIPYKIFKIKMLSSTSSDVVRKENVFQLHVLFHSNVLINDVILKYCCYTIRILIMLNLKQVLRLFLASTNVKTIMLLKRIMGSIRSIAYYHFESIILLDIDLGLVQKVFSFRKDSKLSLVSVISQPLNSSPRSDKICFS